VLDPPESNRDGFLWRGTCVFQISCICLFGTNRAYHHFETPKLQGVFLSETISILTGNNVLDAPPSNNNGVFSRGTHVSST
jgi:hypothetical protein